MRRSGIGSRERSRAYLASMVLVVLTLWGGFSAARLSAADSTTASPAAVESVDENLKLILAGTAPKTVADLRAMQSHVQKLTEQLQKCTVGVEIGRAQGSGVIISKDGYVLTAAHVAGQPNRTVSFFLADGRTLQGKTLGLNRSLDAGLLKIESPGEFPFAEMGVSKLIKEGQWCLATGHPGGYQSDRAPVLRMGRILLADEGVITTDCTLVGGDSGGPLFDMDGRVIGINSRISGALVSNMHVPVGTYKDTWDRLNKGDAWGHYPGQEPVLGVRGEDGTADAKIARVVPRSPAERGGMQAGDVVVRFDDREITDFKSLSNAVANKDPGDAVKLQVKRGDQTVELNIVLGKKSE